MLAIQDFFFFRNIDQPVLTVLKMTILILTYTYIQCEVVDGLLKRAVTFVSIQPLTCLSR